ncbi:MAG: hypothetical protein ACJ8I9_02400, partial [Chthoniobacterales bacterium]
QVTYVLPQLWSWRGGGTQVQLTPPNSPRASAVIEALHLDTPMALDDKAVEAIRQQFTAFLPPGSNGATLISEERDPVPLGGNLHSYEISASYQALGAVYVRSILFVNTPDTQLRFKVTAPKAEFDALYRTFRASLTSWQWTKPAVPESSAAVAEANTPSADRDAN